MECAKKADFQINAADEALKGANPSAAQCKEIIRREDGRDIGELFHPNHPRDQGEMYEEALGGQQRPARVSPAYGISR